LRKEKEKKKETTKLNLVSTSCVSTSVIGAALAASFAVDVVVFEFLAAAAAAVSK
jgi:hypothetical protein